MNTLLHWLTSPEWALVVKTLLHSLWQGAAIAVALALLLRRVASPEARYRIAVTGLGAVLLSAMITWGVLNVPKPAATPAAPMSEKLLTETPAPTGPVEKIVVAANWTQAKQQTQWTAWLALAWLLGASAMLGRASVKIAGAEQLRRSCQPLDDPRINDLVAEARRAVKLTRQVRIAVTHQLTSPAVVGVLMPTLILPLSLLTTLTPEQIRFVLLHELAHIRRGDYLANLFQLFAEALLFFNPSVWWISHQIRREREACCDALAIELSGAPADYARTLVSVAETILTPSPAAAPAFGNEREPSSLSDRVQRVLVPGYRPSLRLTWRAMLGALVVGGVLLGLSAIGTRVTVAAAAKLLTPQERMEQIEKKMVEYGQQLKPEKSTGEDRWSDSDLIPVRAQFRMADGTPLPKRLTAIIHSKRGQSSGIAGVDVGKDGRLKATVWPGTVWIEVSGKGFAPTVAGPFDATGTNQIDAGELVLGPGFNVTLEVVDAYSGVPIANATLRTQFSLRETGCSIQNNGEFKADANGRISVPHCVDQPLSVTIHAPGYEMIAQTFESLQPDQVLRVTTRPGGLVSGVVLDKTDGRPVAGATIRIYSQHSPEGGRGYSWESKESELGSTDADGKFNIQQLRSDSRYWLGVSAPGCESVLLGEIRSGRSNLVARLGPELVIKCRVTGDLTTLRQSDGKTFIAVTRLTGIMGEVRQTDTTTIPVRVQDGVGYFQFTNRVAGRARVSTGGRDFVREVDAPVDDWLIDLNTPAPTNPPTVMREVVFRFKHEGNIPPRGTVEVTIPTSARTGRTEELEIKDGEVRTQMAIGGTTHIKPEKTIGYWFETYFSNFVVTNGTGPQVFEVPAIPAGAIYATARNADGSQAEMDYFSVTELKPSPQRKTHGSVSGGVNSETSRWVSGPLPLGGIYQIVGKRGNSFCASGPIMLTGEKPMAEVELKFPPPETLVGRVVDSSGLPVRGASVDGSFSVTNHGFGLNIGLTDGRGEFQLSKATPGVGEYRVKVSLPGLVSKYATLAFGRTNLIQLRPGLKLTGQVIEDATGYVIPNAEISAAALGTTQLPSAQVKTDENGRFEFNTLADEPYRLYVEGAEFRDEKRQDVRAGQSAEVLLRVKLSSWSELVPVAPAPQPTNAPAKPTANNQPATGPDKGGDISLFSRTFKVDTNVFAQVVAANLKPGETVNFTNRWDVIRRAFASAGADFESQGKTMFYSNGKGTLFVRATLQDLDAIEKLIAKWQEPSPTEGTNLVARTFRVDPNSIMLALEQSGLPAETNLMVGLRKFFAKVGVDLQPPKVMFVNERAGTLFIRSTLADLDTFEKAIQVLSANPPQVNIRAKFVELPANKEGILLGSLGMVSSNFFSWGPGGKVLQASNCFSGILTASQAGEVFKALEKADGVEILTAPEVTTVSGRLAQIQVVDIRSIVTGVSSVGTGSTATNTFQTAPLPFGPVLDVVPYVLADGFTVQMTLIPTVTEFMGYEKPAPAVTKFAKSKSLDAELPLPHFRVRQASATVLVWDGQTVVMGGLIAQIKTLTKDKVPVLGDLPFVGQMFQTESKRSEKKNLFVFVTPTIVDPAGNRVHTDDNMPFPRDAVPQQSPVK